MKAVILAAGSAKRLSPLTDNKHKSLLEIGSKPILEYQLDALDHYGVNNVLIAVGYLKEQIINRYGNRYKNLKIQYIDNPDYATTNTVYSLWLARDYFKNEDFLYFNADVLFHYSLIGRLLKSEKESTLGVEIKKCVEEEVKVIPDEDRRVVRIGKKIDIDKSIGEFVGIGKFGSSLTEDFITSLKSVIDDGNQMSFFEKAVDLILNKHKIYYEDITEIPVIEIDFPEDLEKAKNVILFKILSFGDE